MQKSLVPSAKSAFKFYVACGKPYRHLVNNTHTNPNTNPSLEPSLGNSKE
jgi:hypothetical protein